MRRLFWIIGGALALIVLIGGLIVIALSSRLDAYRPATGETSTVSAATPIANAPVSGVFVVAATSEQLAPTSSQAIPDTATSTLPTNPARATTSAFASGQQAMTRPPDARDLVKYLATRPQEQVDVKAIGTAEGVEIEIAPRTPLYLRDTFSCRATLPTARPSTIG